MKRFKYIQHTFLFIMFGVLTACSDEFLDKEIYGRAPVEEFYQTDQDAYQATIAIYDILQFHNSNGWASPYLVKTLPSDESNAGGSGSSDQPAYQTLDNYNFDSQNDAVLGTWRMHYYGIYRANKVINHVEPENKFRVTLIGEAKALRAYNYFELVSMFGDLPLVLGELDSKDYNNFPRTEKAQVYDQIEKDLRQAIEVLPLKSELEQKFRFSRGAAQALLGKVYLYQEKWDSAAYFLNEVIQSGQYQLAKNYSEIWSEEGEFGVESVFEAEYTNKVGYDWGNFPWDKPRTMESNIHVQLMGPRSDFYKAAPGDSLVAGWGFNTPTAKIYQAFIDAGDEVRRKESLMSEQELKALGGDWTNKDAWGYNGFIRRKYGTYVNQTSSTNGAVTELNYTTNWRLIRYADVLLMAAEAYYRLGQEGQALLYLNEVRERAKLDEISPSGNALFEAIVRERQLELAFEGVRYLDLIRWGRAADELGGLGFVAGKHELYPIPNEDVRIAGLTQNKNW